MLNMLANEMYDHNGHTILTLSIRASPASIQLFVNLIEGGNQLTVTRGKPINT